MISRKIDKYKKGFTIVELLVVIVVIGILAVITIVGYTGVTQRAAAATLESDLKNAATQLELYKAENGTYPSGSSSLPKSSGTEYQYTVVGNDYYLSATSQNNDVIAKYTSSEYGSSVQDGVWSGHTPPGEPTWKQISSNTYHTCAIGTDSKAYCWGYNTYGQLGNGSTTDSHSPVAVNTSGVLSGKTITSITVGENHTCAVASDNNAYCWGFNFNGQLGNNSTSNSNVPVAVNTSGVLSGKTIISPISIREYHACAVASDNNAYCWGYNNKGQLGNNSTSQSTVPVAVNTAGVLSGKTLTAVAVGQYSSCALASDGTVYCWGENVYGQLGNNSTSESHVPVAVNTSGVLSGKTVSNITSGYQNVCSIASDNNAYCWGRGDYGQLGNNSTSQSNVPAAVNTAGVLSGKTISSIKGGLYHTCAVASDNNAYCWGRGDYGQLGNSGNSDSLVPVAVSTSGAFSGKTIKSVAPGRLHTCFVASDNAVYCLGWNVFGQLGDGTTTDSPTPVVATVP